MEQESDHSNSDESGAAAVTSEVGSNVSQLEDRVRALVAEKNQLDADLAQAKSAVEASERELAGSRQKIQELNSEKDRLTGQVAQARSAVETAERELVAATSRGRELAKEKDGLVADIEKAQAQANKVRDQLRALDSESIFDFIRRRYLGQK